MEINNFDDPDQAAAAAGEALNKLLAENKNAPTLLMLSGGSNFSLLDYISPSSLGENLTISMLDERFSQDPAGNNFLQLQKKEFYSIAQSKDCDFFGTLPRPNENMEELKTRWENNLKNWLKNNSQGKILATIGMGADGHVAGIFPDENQRRFEELFQSQNLITAYDIGTTHKYNQRVTTTLTFFKLIDKAIIFITGEEKSKPLNRLISGLGPIHRLPALGIQEAKHYQIFTNVK